MRSLQNAPVGRSKSRNGSADFSERGRRPEHVLGAVAPRLTPGARPRGAHQRASFVAHGPQRAHADRGSARRRGQHARRCTSRLERARLDLGDRRRAELQFRSRPWHLPVRAAERRQRRTLVSRRSTNHQRDIEVQRTKAIPTYVIEDSGAIFRRRSPTCSMRWRLQGVARSRPVPPRITQ